MFSGNSLFVNRNRFVAPCLRASAVTFAARKSLPSPSPGSTFNLSHASGLAASRPLDPIFPHDGGAIRAGA